MSISLQVHQIKSSNNSNHSTDQSIPNFIALTFSTWRYKTFTVSEIQQQAFKPLKRINYKIFDQGNSRALSSISQGSLKVLFKFISNSCGESTSIQITCRFIYNNNTLHVESCKDHTTSSSFVRDKVVQAFDQISFLQPFRLEKLKKSSTVSIPRQASAAIGLHQRIILFIIRTIIEDCTLFNSKSINYILCISFFFGVLYCKTKICVLHQD